MTKLDTILEILRLSPDDFTPTAVAPRSAEGLALVAQAFFRDESIEPEERAIGAALLSGMTEALLAKWNPTETLPAEPPAAAEIEKEIAS